MIKEKCGVVGVYSFSDSNIVPTLVKCLESLQHRGQESWGIAVHGYEIFKRLGLILENPLDISYLEKMEGNVGIAHTRYSTKGSTSIENAHPIDIKGSFAISHNGTIANVDEIAKKVSERNVVSELTDTQLIGIRLKQLYDDNGDWLSSFEILSKELSGSYSMTILTKDGELLAVRDGVGFRPLCLGYQSESDTYIIASESCALDAVDAKLIRDVRPGELVRINKNGFSCYTFAEEERHAHCPFEYTYFAHPTSYLERINVYRARKNIGDELARKYNIDGDVVIPVPDSARPAAKGYAERSGIPFEEGLLKDRYKRSIRSFIEPAQKQREEIVKNIRIVKDVVNGKNVILVDDSIVRGTSSRIIVNKLKNCGAKKISLLSTFPPIRYPCYAGIDFPDRNELFAYRACKDEADIDYINRAVASALGIEFVGYNTIEGLCAIGLPLNELCTSCTNGDYCCLKYVPKKWIK